MRADPAQYDYFGVEGENDPIAHGDAQLPQTVRSLYPLHTQRGVCGIASEERQLRKRLTLYCFR